MEQAGHMNKLKKCFNLIIIVILFICVPFTLISCSHKKTYDIAKVKALLSNQYGIFLSDSVNIINSEYNHILARNPYFDVVFEIFDEHIHDYFDKKMWNESDIDAAFKGSVGIDAVIQWEYELEPLDKHYYYAEMHIEKIGLNAYRVYFCGYGVKSQYLD